MLENTNEFLAPTFPSRYRCCCLSLDGLGDRVYQCTIFGRGCSARLRLRDRFLRNFGVLGGLGVVRYEPEKYHTGREISSLEYTSSRWRVGVQYFLLFVSAKRNKDSVVATVSCGHI
jgi:hypothetical protein